jgi:CRISPR-associated RAMP protein (TIGR02581 family)
MSPLDELKLRRRVGVTARLTFDTGWRIGTGREGTAGSDLGVLLDPAGLPILPGSSLKGRLRATCEGLAHALGLTACFLNAQASGVECASDVQFFRQEAVKEGHTEAVRAGPARQLAWIEQHTCDVCKLFGSQVRAARVRCADGQLDNPEAAVVQVRDGVVLDRDSHTAVRGLKYDYEVLPAGTRFRVRFDLDNPADADEALFGAALFEWVAGSNLGGFTSRGLGRFHLEDVHLSKVDLQDPKERVRYLTAVDPAQRLGGIDDWQGYFTRQIEAHLRKGG